MTNCRSGFLHFHHHDVIRGRTTSLQKMRNFIFGRQYQRNRESPELDFCGIGHDNTRSTFRLVCVISRDPSFRSKPEVAYNLKVLRDMNFISTVTVSAWAEVFKISTGDVIKCSSAL